MAPEISPAFPPGFSPKNEAVMSHYKNVVHSVTQLRVPLHKKGRSVGLSSVEVTMSNLSNDMSFGISIHGAMR